jgi:hypothetical protein
MLARSTGPAISTADTAPFHAKSAHFESLQRSFQVVTDSDRDCLPLSIGLGRSSTCLVFWSPVCGRRRESVRMRRSLWSSDRRTADPQTLLATADCQCLRPSEVLLGLLVDKPDLTTVRHPPIARPKLMSSTECRQMLFKCSIALYMTAQLQEHSDTSLTGAPPDNLVDLPSAQTVRAL